MIPHVDVHGRCDHDWSGGREIEGGEEVGGNALGKVRENVGGGGSHEESVNRLRDRDVLDSGVDVGGLLFSGREHAGREHSCNHFLAGERSEGERANELLGGAGHDDLHANAAVLQEPYNLGCFVSGDSAGDSESNLHMFTRQRLKAAGLAVGLARLKACPDTNLATLRRTLLRPTTKSVGPTLSKTKLASAHRL